MWSTDIAARTMAYLPEPLAALALRALSRGWREGFGRAVRAGWGCGSVPPVGFARRGCGSAIPAPAGWDAEFPGFAPAGWTPESASFAAVGWGAPFPVDGSDVSPDWVHGAVHAGLGETASDVLGWACLEMGVLRPAAALRHAARTGNVALLDELCLAPWSLGHADGTLVMALPLAAAGGHAGAVERLLRAPWSLTNRHAVRMAAENGHAVLLGALLAHIATPDRERVAASAFDAAVANGHVGVIDALVRLGVPATGDAVAQAVGSGHANVLRRLTEPPFSFGFAGTTGAALVLAAAKQRTAAVLDCLIAPPWSLSADVPRGWAGEPDALLNAAARAGSVAVLDRLALPPFNRGHNPDAVALLVCAAESGSVAAFERLLLPPYSSWAGTATRKAAQRLLTAATNGGSAQLLELLAAPPFLVGQDDARESRALPMAVRGGHAAVVHRLALPPYSLGDEDAAAVWPHAVRCKRAVDVVDALLRYSTPEAARAHAARIAALETALRHADGALLDRLARPPFSFGGDDVRAQLAWRPFRGSDEARADRMFGYRDDGDVAVERWTVGHGPRGGDVVCNVDGESATLNAVPSHGGSRALGIALLSDAYGGLGMLGRLLAPPFSIGRADALACGCAVVCWAGRSPGGLHRLTRPPFSLTRNDVAARNGWVAMEEAAATGSVGAMDVLVRDYGVGREHARAAGRPVGVLVLLAAVKHHISALGWLAGAPLWVAREDLDERMVTELRAAHHRDPGVAQLLSRPPFCLT